MAEFGQHVLKPKLDHNWTKFGQNLDQNWTRNGPNRAGVFSLKWVILSVIQLTNSLLLETMATVKGFSHTSCDLLAFSFLAGFEKHVNNMKTPWSKNGKEKVENRLKMVKD